MSTEVFLAIMLIVIIFIVIIGTKFDLNIGLLGLGFAYILGCLVLGLSPTEVFNMWPTKVMLQIIGITFFFGFLGATGSIQVITDYVLYYTGNRLYLLPFVAFCLCGILTFFGVTPPAVSALVTPIFISACANSGYSIPLTVLGITSGQTLGAISPFGQAGLLTKSYIESGFGAEMAAQIMPTVYLNNLVAKVIIVAIGYLVFRGWKVGTQKITSAYTKPKVTREQKICFLILLLSVIVVMLPALLSDVLDFAWIKFFAKHVDVGFVYLIAGLVCWILRLGNGSEVIKKSIPWNVLLIIGGMGCLFSVASAGGATELLSSMIQNSIPAVLIVPIMALLAGTMSLFSDSIGVVLPLLLPLAPGITAATGISVSAFATAVATGALTSGIAPFSTGGAVIFSFVPEFARKKMFVYQLIMAIVCVCIVALLALVHIIR